MKTTRKLNLSFGCSVFAIMLSFAMLLSLLVAEDKADQLSFISAIAAFIGISVTLVVGYQIYNAVELKQKINAVEARIDTVANRNIDKSVLARERNGGFATVFCERIEARSPAAAHYYADYILNHIRIYEFVCQAAPNQKPTTRLNNSCPIAPIIAPNFGKIQLFFKCGKFQRAENISETNPTTAYSDFGKTGESLEMSILNGSFAASKGTRYSLSPNTKSSPRRTSLCDDTSTQSLQRYTPPSSGFTTFPTYLPPSDGFKFHTKSSPQRGGLPASPFARSSGFSIVSSIFPLW